MKNKIINKLLTSNNEEDQRLGVQFYLKKNRYGYYLLDFVLSIVCCAFVVPLIFTVWAFFHEWKLRKGIFVMHYKRMKSIINNDDFKEIVLPEEDAHVIITPFTGVYSFLYFVKEERDRKRLSLLDE